MPLVLSTKILTPAQKRHLFLADISLVEYNAIKLNPLEISLPKNHFENAIFTSQNAVKFALDLDLSIEKAFCVGDKTAALVEQANIPVTLKANDAKALGELIIKSYNSLSFAFFCSKQRRNELPALFKKNQVDWIEHHLYESLGNHKKFNNQFDAVLCFSPLGTASFYESNRQKPLAICIGETTANTAKQITDEVIISSNTSVESVIISAIKYFKK